MAVDQNAREEVVRFLDERAFDPILRTSPERCSGGNREKLEHATDAAERTRRRYHDYASAEEVRDRFREDLSSLAAQRVQRKLARLRLPTLHEVEDEFGDLCRDLGAGR